MVSSIAEVNEDSFGVPDMKETIGLGRETCPDVSSRGSEMLISKEESGGFPPACEVLPETLLRTLACGC